MHHVMYQALVCHEELDCAERGRASHLNPLRAGIGADGRELHRSPDGGHSAVVGEAEWVEASVNQAKEHATRQPAWTRRGVGFAHRVARVAAIVRVEPHDVVAQGRQRRRVDARSLLGFRAVREWGVSRAEMARTLGMSPPGVGYAVQRGEARVRRNRDELGR